MLQKMAKETTGSSRVTEKGPVTRSSTETLFKKVVLTPSKETPSMLAVRGKSEKTATTATTTPSPLRRSERTRNPSPSPSPCSGPSPASQSSASKKHKAVNQSTFEERDDAEAASSKLKRMDARAYRRVFTRSKRDCHVGSSRSGSLTQEGGDGGGARGDKIDECFKGDSLDSKAVSKDGVLPPEDSKAKDQGAKSRSSGHVKELLENKATQGSPVPSDATSHETSGASERVQSDCHRDEASQTSASKSSILNESLIRKCAGHDNGENLIPSKRKRTMGDKDSDISATLVNDENYNLTVDASPSRLCSNIVETSELCSKRIRRISLSDVQRDQKKLINNVDQPCSKSIGERLSTRNEEERPQGHGVETENIRKKQKRLHLTLKPEIARLCEILLLPDNVKSMVENCLEYTMNNYQISTEPVSILQAFQLSLCWTASSLLNHKLDFEASVGLAKRHLNFDCDKDVVDEINSKMLDLKESFLSLTGNSEVTGSSKASESPSRSDSNKNVTEVELVERDISKNIKEEKHKNQWENLRWMQRKEKQKLKSDIENEVADFRKRCNIEWAAIRSFSPNDVIRKEKRQVYRSGYEKRFTELKRQHDIRLKDLEAKQLEAMRKFQESLAPDESLNLVASKELGAPQNAPKALVSDHVAEGKSSENIVGTMSSTGKGVGLSETNPSVVVLCSSPDKPHTPLVNHAGVNEMDSMASKEEPAFGNKCHNIAEIEYEGEGNILSKHSNYREQCSDGAARRADEDEGCENFNRESHNDCWQDSVTLVPLSSNGEICDGETSDIPGREVALAVQKSSCSNYDKVDIPSSSINQTSDGVLSSGPCTSSPSNSHPAAISLLNPPSQQQVPDTVLSTIPDGQIPVIMPESSHEEAEGQLIDSAVVSKSTASDQQEGVHRTMIENTLSQATTVSRSVDLIEPREERRSLSSLESPHNQDTAKEAQNSGVSNAVDILPVNQSNQTSLVMEPPEQVQQLPSAGFLSSNQDLSNLHLVTGIEDQATNDGALSSHIPEASVEVQNQAVEQPASNLEVDYHSRQVVHPASNLDTDSLMSGGVTTPSSDSRNLSTQGDINNHPIPTATQSASRVVPPLYHDPLYNELERMRKLAEQNMKNHEIMKLQCKCDYTKELVELRTKYEIKLKEIEGEFQRTKKELDTQLNTVYAHRILAETFKATSLDLKVSGASGMRQDGSLGQHLSQLSRQEHASRPYMVAPPSSCVPSAASLPSSHATPGSQMMLPPTPATYNTTGTFSGVSPRPPLINTISSPSGSIQAGGEIRAPAPHLQPFRPSTPVPPPAPHLQPFRPSTSVPAPTPHLQPFRPSTSTQVTSSLFTVPHGMPIQPSPGNTHLPSPLFSHLLPRPSTIIEPGHHRGHWPESTGGLPARNLPAMDFRPDACSLSGNPLPNILPRLSDLTSLDLSKFVTSSSVRANSPHQPTSPDVVCLSDDD